MRSDVLLSQGRPQLPSALPAQRVDRRMPASPALALSVTYNVRSFLRSLASLSFLVLALLGDYVRNMITSLYKMNSSLTRRAHLRCLLVWGFLVNKKPNLVRLGLGAKRCPTLTGGSPQLPSALESLTSVFGMGTGVASLPSSLHFI